MDRKQFRCNSQSIKMLEEAQKQKTAAECGLYAETNATSVAFGMDPTKLAYNEKCMREHLVYCFSTKDLEPFLIINEV